MHAASCPMKKVSTWREPTATKTTTDRRLRLCVPGLLVSSCAQNKIIDDISTVWLAAIQRMVAVHQGHLFHQPQRPPTTPVSLLAARLELQRLSMPSRCRQLDASVDQEVSRLLRSPPSPRLPQPAAARRPTKRRTAGAGGTRDNVSISARPLSSSRWTEQGDKTWLCRLQRHSEDVKRPCLDFNKMQARLLIIYAT